MPFFSLFDAMPPRRFPRQITRFVAAAGALFGALTAACASGPWWQGLTAQQIWERGEAQFADEDYGDAATTLGRLLLDFPAFEGAADAQFMLAEAYFNDKQYISAQSEFTRFIDRFPTNERAPEAAMGVCRSNEALSPISQRDQSFTLQALQVCQNVMNDWFGTPQAEEAAAVVQEMREKLARKIWENGWYYQRRSLLDPALIYYEDIIERYPETSFAPRALLGMIEIYGIFGYDEEVESAREQLLTRYPESPEAKTLETSGVSGSESG